MTDHPAPEVRETHISWVILVGERAYKILKPVTMPFLDLADRDQRTAAVDRELECNRRIAPDVYRGTADVVEDGVVVDRILVMRRLPADRRLSSRVGCDDFAGCLRQVARAVAAFHAGTDAVEDAPMAARDAVLRNWDDNFAAIEPTVGSVIDRVEFDRVAELARTYLAGREPLFEERVAAGLIRDGHGDLLAEDIFCLDDGPRMIDCLAFDDDYRIGDVLLDIAFLIMDVERLAGRDAARDLMDWYREFSDEHHPPSLAHHFVAYRAHVRAKVACLRLQQGDEASADAARRYHRLALDHLERARVRLILVGGGPGFGKSVLAERLADHFNCTVLATDEIRKDLTGTPREAHRFARPGAGVYGTETVDAVYREQLREAELLLRRGQSVVLDASWTHERHRAAARNLAEVTHAELIEIECVLDPDMAKERIASRLSSPWNSSDATPEIVDHLARDRDPWPEAVSIDTAPPPDAVFAQAIPAVAGSTPAATKQV